MMNYFMQANSHLLQLLKQGMILFHHRFLLSVSQMFYVRFTSFKPYFRHVGKSLAYFLGSLLLLLSLLPGLSFAQTKNEPLPADHAFAISATFDRANNILVEWRIAPGYYLYAKRIHFSFNPETPADIHLPQGDLHYGANQERSEVFSSYLSVPVSLQPKQAVITLSVDYQGCSQGGFCYPPMNKNFKINTTTSTITPLSSTILLPAPLTSAALQTLMTDQNGVFALFQSVSTISLLFIFLALGLLLAFTPCILPMVPILTGIIVGQAERVTTRKAFLLSLAYVLGGAITYAIAGVVAAAAGSSLQVWLQKPITVFLTSVLFVVLALSLFGFYELRLPTRWQNQLTQLSHHQRRGTYLGVFLMGMLSTLIVSPCVTAPLVGVLMYIGQTGDLLFGASALFVMGIGMGIPLLLVGVSAGKCLPKSGPWMEAMKKFFGVLMLAMAIWLLSRILSPTFMMKVWGLFLLGMALFFMVTLPRLLGRHGWYRSVGAIIGCLGVLLMAGFTPMTLLNHEAKMSTSSAPQNFMLVQNVMEFDAQLAIAKATHRPILLDFYADWCESCVMMDRHVFSLADVKQALSNYILLRIDLSNNGNADEKLLKYFNVIAPPTILFFAADGREANTHRIVGEVGAKEFLNRLNLFMAASCSSNTQC